MTYRQTALTIFDGYQKGGLIPTQDLPKFLQEIVAAGRRADIPRAKLLNMLKPVKKEIAKRTTAGMRPAVAAHSLGDDLRLRLICHDLHDRIKRVGAAHRLFYWDALGKQLSDVHLKPRDDLIRRFQVHDRPPRTSAPAR